MTIDTPNKEDEKKVDTPSKEPKDEKPEDKKVKEGETEPQGDKMVEVSEKELNQLKQTKNLTANLQNENDRLRKLKVQKKVEAPNTEFSLEEPEPEPKPSAETGDNSQVAEHIRLQGILNQKVASNPKFLDLIRENDLLGRIISNTPLDILKPEEKENLIDADDAVDKIVLSLEAMIAPEEEKKPDEEKKEEKAPDSVTDTGDGTKEKKGSDKDPEKTGAEKVEETLNTMFK